MPAILLLLLLPLAHATNHNITRVHVVAMNHLDVGFSCPFCGNGNTPRSKIDTVPAPYTWQLLNLYMNKFLPDAVSTSRATNGTYVYTTHCYLISFFFDCGGLGADPAFPLECPTASAVADVTDAIERGWLVWHAFPFNSEPETCDAELFGDGVGMCHELNDRFRRPRAQVMSQRDVPGLTRAVIPLLADRGVTAVTVGANVYSASASVPRIYRWTDPVSGSSLIALQHPGGYGDGSTVVIPGSVNALHVMFNPDNAGPHTPAQVAARHAQLSQLYPNAHVAGATWDEYVEAIRADGSAATLPDMEKEEGDTWIYGVQQDLYKTAAFRGIMRARRRCVAELGHSVCGGNATAALANSTRFALKLSEHTWGFTWGYMDLRHYTNDALAFALQHVGGFAKIVDGWREQRAYVNHAVDALGAAGPGDLGAERLLEMTRQELEALRPTAEPETSGWTEIDATQPVTDLPMFANVEWNASAGGIQSLVTKSSVGHDFVKGRASFAQYQYETLTEDDFWVFMNETLKVQRDVAFAKANLTRNANVTSGFWVGSSLKMYRKDDSFLQRVTMDAHLHGYYGAPARVWTLFEFSKVAARVNVTVSIFNKTRTRLPEAQWVDFEVAVPVQAVAPTQLPRCESWSVAKLGSTLCASDVSLFGSTHIHAVSDADSAHGSVSISGGDTLFRLTTHDAALLSLEYKSAFPNPVHKALDGGRKVQSAYVCLSNNFWTTNYPNWYPFVEGDADAVFRFEVRLGL